MPEHEPMEPMDSEDPTEPMEHRMIPQPKVVPSMAEMMEGTDMAMVPVLNRDEDSSNSSMSGAKDAKDNSHTEASKGKAGPITAAMTSDGDAVAKSPGASSNKTETIEKKLVNENKDEKDEMAEESQKEKTNEKEGAVVSERQEEKMDSQEKNGESEDSKEPSQVESQLSK